MLAGALGYSIAEIQELDISNLHNLYLGKALYDINQNTLKAALGGGVKSNEIRKLIKNIEKPL